MSVNKREGAEDIEYRLFKSSPKSFILYKILRSIGRVFFSHGLIVILFGLLMMFICNNAKVLKDGSKVNESSVVMKSNTDCTHGITPVTNYLNVVNVNDGAGYHESAVSEKVSKNVKSRVESKSTRNKAQWRGCDILPRIHNSDR